QETLNGHATADIHVRHRINGDFVTLANPTVCNPHTPVVAEFKPVIVSGLDLHDILVVANSADAITGVSTTASDFDLKIVIAAGAVAVLLAMFPCS
uniref:Uncharacterized protein n=1 Tax=Oryza glaberrima TaxID=4538 RepID=I1PK61_ORYGL